MKYRVKDPGRRGEEEALFEALEPVVKGLGMSLIGVSLSRHRGSAQVRVTVDKAGMPGGRPGIDDCSRVHRAILPRVELALPGVNFYLEVSTPGIDHLIKEGAECAHFTGRGIRLFRTDASCWVRGILRGADEKAVTLEREGGLEVIPYESIGKARLDGEKEL